MNPFVLSIVITIVPTLLWFVFYYRRDREHPEPVYLLLKTFAWGMLSAGCLLGLQWLVTKRSGISIVANLQNQDISQVGIVFLLALLEEAIKGFFLYYLLGKNRQHLNQHIDGIIYGVSLALGFAFVENVVYFIDLLPLLSRWDFLLTYLFRTLGTMFAHTLFTGLLGYFVTFGILDYHNHKNVIKKAEKLFYSLKDFLREVFTFHTIYQHILAHHPSEKGHFLFGIFVESLFLSTIFHFVFNLFLSTGIFEKDLVFLSVPFLFLLGSYLLQQFKYKQAVKLRKTLF